MLMPWGCASCFPFRNTKLSRRSAGLGCNRLWPVQPQCGHCELQMPSFEQVVKNACKPKFEPPKSKVKHPIFCHSIPLIVFGQYVDPIIAATLSEDGAIHDVCKALAPRFRELNSIVGCSSQFVSCQTYQWAETLSGGVQGAHRPPYHNSGWRNRQCASVFVFFGGFTVKGRHQCLSMERYVICAWFNSIIPLC
jgi:bacterioferritin-associated ferredoxin